MVQHPFLLTELPNYKSHFTLRQDVPMAEHIPQLNYTKH